MKKIVNLLLVLVICMGLAGCGNTKPNNMSDESYETGLDMLDATNDYLDDKIDKSEFESTMDRLRDNLRGDEVGDIDVRTTSQRITLSLYIDRQSVKKARDELAEALGQ